MNKEERASYLQTGDTVECGACFPYKYEDCKDLEKQLPNFKCKCNCHKTNKKELEKEFDKKFLFRRGAIWWSKPDGSEKRIPSPDEIKQFINKHYIPRKEVEEVVKDKNNAYRERDLLVCALTKLFPAYLARHDENDKDWDDDWRWIVYIEISTGQVSWHINDSERGLFDHLEVRSNDWDGHTTEEKYKRLEGIKDKPTNL